MTLVRSTRGERPAACVGAVRRGCFVRRTAAGVAHLRRDREARAEHELQAADVALGAVADEDLAGLDDAARVELLRDALPQVGVAHALTITARSSRA